MRVLFSGCWHLNRSAALRVIAYAESLGVDTIVQTGDFLGFGQGTNAFLIALDEALKKRNINLVFVRGNHDSLDTIKHFVSGWDSDGMAFMRHSKHIKYAPNALRWEWEGVSLLAMGGAHSVDWPFRTPGVDWFSDEQISFAEAEKALSSGESSDIMVMHDVPLGVPLSSAITSARNSGWDVEGAWYNRKTLQDIVDAVNPKLLVSGHMHSRMDGVTSSGVDYAVLDRIDYLYDSETVQSVLESSSLVVELQNGIIQRGQ